MAHDLVVTGRCHICERRLPIEFCEACDHWFCETCRGRWFGRGLSFLKSFLGEPVQRCCGPDDEERRPKKAP